MRIKELHIDGFGIFTDFRLGGLGPNLTILLGANEAGKSTLLAFVRGVLFGFPDGRSRDNPYPPLSGGRHGGCVILVDQAGVEYTVERYVGPRGGAVSLRATNGDNGGDAQLRALLGSATRDLFRNVYAFSLTELQSFESLQAEAVKAALYGASAGTAVLALPRFQQELEAFLGNVFKPGGSNPLLNQALREFEGLSTEIRGVQGGLATYTELVREISESERKITEAVAEIDALTDAEAEQGLRGKLLPVWVGLQQDREERSALPPRPVPPLPPQGLARLDQLLEVGRVRKEELERAESALEQMRRSRESLAVDDAILGQAENIRLLRVGAGSHDEGCTRAERLRNEPSTLERELARLLGELGPDWTVERVRAADRSLFVQDELLKHESALRELGNRQAVAWAHREKTGGELREATADKERASAVLGTLPAVADLPPRKLLDQLRAGRDRFADNIEAARTAGQEVRADDEEIRTIVGSIAPGWTEARAATFDTSIGVRTRIDEFEQGLVRAGQELAAARAEVASAEERLRGAQQNIARAKEAGAALERPTIEDPAEILRRRRAAHLAQAELAQLDALRMQLESERKTRSRREQVIGQLKARTSEGPSASPYLAPIVLGLGGFVVAAVLIWRQQMVPAALVFALTVMVAYLMIAGARRGGASATDNDVRGALQRDIELVAEQCAKFEEQIREQLSRLHTRAAELGLEGDPTVESVKAVEAALGRDQGLIEEWRVASSAVSQAVARAEQAKEAVERTRELRARNEETLANLKQQWVEQLEPLGLPVDLSPRVVATGILPAVERARQKIRDRDGKRLRLEALSQDMGRFIEVACDLVPNARVVRDEPRRLLVEVDGFLDRAEAAADALKARGEAQKELGGANTVLARATEAHQKACSAVESADRELAAAQRDWVNWLEQRRLPAHLSPETAAQGIRTMSAVLERADRVDAIDGELRQIESHLQEYRILDANTFGALGRPVPDERSTTAAAAGLGDELDAAREAATKRKGLDEQLNAARSTLAEARGRVEQADADVGELLAQAGVSHAEVFRERAQIEAKHERVQGEIESKERLLREIAGIANPDTLASRLAGVELLDVEKERARLRNEKAEKSQHLEALRNNRAQLVQEKERLGSAEDLAGLRAAQERVRSRVVQLSREWARFAVARHLLDEAKGRFEREHQPKVLKDASRFFTRITAGRYDQVRAGLGPRDASLEVLTSSGVVRRPDELSRGTQEQLYLALRFGYMLNHRLNEESLPVLMDDILVNFDPERATGAAAAIFELARGCQVLLYTCHPATADLLRRIDGKAPIVALPVAKAANAGREDAFVLPQTVPT
jgi:uncharacterized protein YhaN